MSSFIENEIIRSTTPIHLEEDEEIEVFGERGIWANKQEVLNWKGPIPIKDYKLNEDSNPEKIVKTCNVPVEYSQNITVKYLKPPTPPPHGDLIIKQENDIIPAEAPPLVIRQHSVRPLTPEPLILREKPPTPPQVLPTQIVTLPGKVLDPPPRKIIIERMADLPAKPQPIIIEKWLPYGQQKRNVVFESTSMRQPRATVRNTIIQWHRPKSLIDKRITYLGVQKMDPIEYRLKHGSNLKEYVELPAFVKEFRENSYLRECANKNKNTFLLEGDVDALDLLDAQSFKRLGFRRSFSSTNIYSTVSSSSSNVNYHQSKLYIIDLKKSRFTNDYGIVIRGGAEFNMSLYVLNLVANGVACLDGRLKSGDEIIQINGMSTANMKLGEASSLIKSKDSVSLLVKRTGLPPPTASDVFDAMMNGRRF